MDKFLEEGDIIELTGEHKVYADVPKHLVFSNCKGDWSLTKHDVQLTGEFDYLQGSYVVIKTETKGGGYGHGKHDVYPDGHYVTAESLDGKHRVSFYQSGAFTAMIRPSEIQSTGKAQLKYVMPEAPGSEG